MLALDPVELFFFFFFSVCVFLSQKGLQHFLETGLTGCELSFVCGFVSRQNRPQVWPPCLVLLCSNSPPQVAAVGKSHFCLPLLLNSSIFSFRKRAVFINLHRFFNMFLGFVLNGWPYFIGFVF